MDFCTAENEEKCEREKKKFSHSNNNAMRFATMTRQMRKKWIYIHLLV